MNVMQSVTRLYATDELDAAATGLKSGQVIAFPTETVYGLGANALDGLAVDRVFEAKGRPSDNPLIVHIADRFMLDCVATSVPPNAELLMRNFWPGPLTLLFPRHSSIPDSVTAGLDTVAVRMPNHPVALELIRRSSVPIVAPSANRSGRPSATTWQAVLEDLDGRIGGVVCGPPSLIGLESTVVDSTCLPPQILRQGAISIEDLRLIIPEMTIHESQDESSNRSPGLRHPHYQPQAKVRLVPDAPTQWAGSDMQPSGRLQHQLAWIGLHPPTNPTLYRVIEICDSVDMYAARLYDFFRRMDHLGIDRIDCERVALSHLGRALMDRLERASMA